MNLLDAQLGQRIRGTSNGRIEEGTVVRSDLAKHVVYVQYDSSLTAVAVEPSTLTVISGNVTDRPEVSYSNDNSSSSTSGILTKRDIDYIASGVNRGVKLAMISILLSIYVFILGMTISGWVYAKTKDPALSGIIVLITPFVSFAVFKLHGNKQ